MHDEVVSALSEIESAQDVRVLFACESGSRAWGFASTDSDYDVRFIYVRPLASYLSVRPTRDVIEAMLPNDLDLAGWDLRKTLQLLTKSNPALFEWLRSPIVYTRDDNFMAEFGSLSQRWYSPRRIFLHYLHMAQGNWKAYLQGEEVSRKKYLYVLRPVLACRWIEEGLGPVPMEFDTLRTKLALEPALARAIDLLVEEKRAGAELAMGPPDAVIQAFLETELPRLQEVHMQDPEPPSVTELDAFLLRWVLATG